MLTLLATQTFSELNFWLGKGISLLLSTGLTAWTLSTVQRVWRSKNPVLAAVMQIFIYFHQGPPSTIWQGPRRPLHKWPLFKSAPGHTYMETDRILRSPIGRGRSSDVRWHQFRTKSQRAVQKPRERWSSAYARWEFGAWSKPTDLRRSAATICVNNYTTRLYSNRPVIDSAVFWWNIWHLPPVDICPREITFAVICLRTWH